MKIAKPTTKHFLFGLGGITSYVIAYLTMLGTVQQYIFFEDPMNEMLFFCTACMLGALCIFSAIPRSHYSKEK
mgnify:CR=1 FL=1